VAHSLAVLRVMLLSAVVVSVAAGVLFITYSKNLRGIWKDSRDREGAALAVIAFLCAAVFTLLTFRLWNADWPAWSAKIIAASAQFGSFMFKLLFFSWFFIWVRWTLPRFRYDQLMRLGWKNLIPLAFANIFATGLLLLIAGR